MNELIINEIAKDLNVKVKQVETVLNLLSDGNTIPFIARYRKEATGALDEEEIRKIDEVYQYQVNLSKRKDDVIRLIDEKGLLTDELKNDLASKTTEKNINKLAEEYDKLRKSASVKIGRFIKSSQPCHVCGYINPWTKELSVREWTCPCCGTVHDRDVNAAINILNEGLRILREPV